MKLGWVIIALLATAGAPPAPAVINAFGDSLSAGYGLPAGAGFAPALQNLLSQRGHSVTVINAAVAGDTTADALRRADWMLQNNPDIVIVQFGANDMMRALPPPMIYDNLARVIEKIRARGARVLLAGMRAPDNLGRRYRRAFDDIYRRLETERQVLTYPFFLRGVALHPALNLSDGIHPNAEGVRVIARGIAPWVEQLLARKK